jgi:hypothetical protein
MASVAPDELWRLWKTEQITPEMAIGQLIQNQVNHEQAMQSANLARTTLRRELDGCAAQLKTHQKLLETLQQAIANLQRVAEGSAHPSKPRSRKDTPNTDTQP